MDTTISRTTASRESTSTSTYSCPLCQGTMRLWLRVPGDCKKGRPNDHSEVYWCDACAYGSVQPIPTAEQVAEFYQLDHYYTQGASHFEPEGDTSVLDRLRVHLAWRLDRGEPTSAKSVDAALGGKKSTIIDLGCGGGQLAADLAALGHSVVGVEVDPNAISRQHRGAFECFAGTAEALPSEVLSRKFDCVVMTHVLEHCREPIKALKNVHAILKPEGKFVCEVPNNAAAAFDHVGCAWEMFDVPRHLHFFTPQSLARACEVAGFRVQQTTFGHYVRQFTNGWINTERKLWSNLMKVQPAPSPAPTQNSKLYSWQLLAKTVAAPPERKYDSMSVVAVPR